MPRPVLAPPSGPSPRSETAPHEHRGQVLSGRVRLDNGTFIDCRFRKAVLVYAGLGPTQISSCSFEQTVFEFDGPAANALGFLQAMSNPASGLREVVKASFPRIFAH